MGPPSWPRHLQPGSNFCSMEMALGILPECGWARGNAHHFSAKNVQPPRVASRCAGHHEEVAIHGCDRRAQFLWQRQELAREGGRPDYSVASERGRELKVVAPQVNADGREDDWSRIRGNCLSHSRSTLSPKKSLFRGRSRRHEPGSDEKTQCKDYPHDLVRRNWKRRVSFVRFSGVKGQFYGMI